MRSSQDVQAVDFGHIAVLLDRRTGGISACEPGAIDTVPISAVSSNPGWGTHEVQITVAPPASMPLKLRMMANFALAITLVVRHAGRKRSGFARLVRLIKIAQLLCRRPAS